MVNFSEEAKAGAQMRRTEKVTRKRRAETITVWYAEG
jgi:hypothetical protein